jgi:probable rRNA maturation factor
MTCAKSDQDINIQISRNFEDIEFSLSKLKKLIKAVCRRFGKDEIINPNTASMKYEISITIVDDNQFKKINKRFSKHKSISDCLSFDLSDSKEPCSLKTFELIINGQMALRQAKLRGHSSEAELALYITHGLLHNFGFDDLEPDMAKAMHEKEDEILQELGFGLVYNRSIVTQKNINRRNRKY